MPSTVENHAGSDLDRQQITFGKLECKRGCQLNGNPSFIPEVLQTLTDPTANSNPGPHPNAQHKTRPIDRSPGTSSQQITPWSDLDPCAPAPQRLIIFTRYPTPGQTKTRLIPALGPEGAAGLQRQMTEHTLTQARAWGQAWDQAWDRHPSPPLIPNPPDILDPDLPGPDTPSHLEVRYTGASAEAMAEWLGAGVRFQPQGDGDLGDRMGAAFQAAFADGIGRVVIIGIDCPDVSTALLVEAFEALQTQDIVLGPATDGGYYLIGLRRWIPDLFTAMPWGSDRVLRLTLDRAEALQIRPQQLIPLNDIDRPEDLPLCERFPWGHTALAALARKSLARETLTQKPFPQTSLAPEPTQQPLHEQPLTILSPSSPPPTLSVIIPTLNEAAHIGATLQALRTATANLPTEVEIIVVDGGSTDATRSTAKAAGATVITTESGRAAQLNQGARIAQGTTLLFLHGDTQVCPDFIHPIEVTLAQSGVVAGAFQLAIEGSGWQLRGVEWGTNLRSRLLQFPYGDQGLFLRKSTFEAVGPFAEIPIMEDFELVQRLQRLGRIATAPAAVRTSDRRWRKLGVVRTTVINQLMVLGYFLGLDLNRLARFYRRQRALG